MRPEMVIYGLGLHLAFAGTKVIVSVLKITSRLAILPELLRNL